MPMAMVEWHGVFLLFFIFTGGFWRGFFDHGLIRPAALGGFGQARPPSSYVMYKFERPLFQGRVVRTGDWEGWPLGGGGNQTVVLRLFLNVSPVRQ